MGCGSLFLSLQEGANVSKCGWLRKGLGGPTRNPDWATAVAGPRPQDAGAVRKASLGPTQAVPLVSVPFPGLLEMGQGWERSLGPWGMAGGT